MTICLRLQGLQRVQQAPAISKAMHSLLWRCQQRIGHWVGSSVIHLGDHNVPNALMFIDKYTQVGRDCCVRRSSFGRCTLVAGDRVLQKQALPSLALKRGAAC